jgi:hypothetical protein
MKYESIGLICPIGPIVESNLLNTSTGGQGETEQPTLVA